MTRLLIFGPGYSAQRIMRLAEGRGWDVETIDRKRFENRDACLSAIRQATHILSTVPPVDGADPVLGTYGEALALAPAQWIGYLSSTGVYGDAGGAWIDEGAALSGRRNARIEADLGWQTLRPDLSIFRLPGIYGPGRSQLDKVSDGSAHRIDAPGHIFSRIHVNDLARAVAASWSAPPSIYNLADDYPAPQEQVVAYAAQLLSAAPPPLQSMDEAQLSPAARGFYSASRRISNVKAKRILGWQPSYPDFRSGLRACLKGV